MEENRKEKAKYKFIRKNTYSFIVEPIGDTQPKYWFIPKNISSEDDAIDKTNINSVFLVKRGIYSKGSKNRRRSFRQNSVGEYVGYRLAKMYEDEINKGIAKKERIACPVFLICFNTRDNKDGRKNATTLFPACASERLMEPNDVLEPAESFIEQFRIKQNEKYNEILENSKKYGSGNYGKSEILQSNSKEDILEIGLAALEYRIRDFEMQNGINENIIEEDIKKARIGFLRMCIFDILTGNNDRHTNNYSIILKASSHRARLYELYDNERVLGLYNSANEMEKINLMEQEGKRVEDIQGILQFSRMGVGSINSGSDYRDVTDYLISKYPDEVIPIIKQMTKAINPKSVSELLNEFDGIDGRTEKIKILKSKIRLEETGKISSKNLKEDKKVYQMFILPKCYKEYANLIISKRHEYLQEKVRQYEVDKERSI